MSFVNIGFAQLLLKVFRYLKRAEERVAYEMLCLMLARNTRSKKKENIIEGINNIS